MIWYLDIFLTSSWYLLDILISGAVQGPGSVVRPGDARCEMWDALSQRNATVNYGVALSAGLSVFFGIAAAASSADQQRTSSEQEWTRNPRTHSWSDRRSCCRPPQDLILLWISRRWYIYSSMVNIVYLSIQGSRGIEVYIIFIHIWHVCTWITSDSSSSCSLGLFSRD